MTASLSRRAIVAGVGGLAAPAIHRDVAAWKKLPADLQDIVGRRMTEAATLERADWTERNKTVTKHMQDNGMILNSPDTEPFRQVLRKSGFYPEMRQRMGDEAWRLLEKYSGPLA